MKSSKLPEPTNYQLNQKLDKILAKLDMHDQKFEQHDEQFKTINNQLKQHDERFKTINNQLKQHDHKHDEHDTKFQQLINQNNQLIAQLVSNEQKIDAIDHRTRFLPDHNTYLKHQDMLDHRLDRIEEALVILTGHKDQLEDHETRITTLEANNAHA